MQFLATKNPELFLLPVKLAIAAILSASAIPQLVMAQTADPALYANLEWRMIGPFRAGRTDGATRLRQQPNGVNNAVK